MHLIPVGDLKQVLWPSIKGQGHHRSQSEKAVALVEAYLLVNPLSAVTKSEVYRIVCSNSVNICGTENYNLSMEMTYYALLGKKIIWSIWPQTIEQSRWNATGWSTWQRVHYSGNYRVPNIVKTILFLRMSCAQTLHLPTCQRKQNTMAWSHWKLGQYSDKR